MKKFFKSHFELVLVALTLLFAAIVVGYFFWGISVLVAELNRAIGGQAPAQTTGGFDLKGAKALDLKGLIK